MAAFNTPADGVSTNTTGIHDPVEETPAATGPKKRNRVTVCRKRHLTYDNLTHAAEPFFKSVSASVQELNGVLSDPVIFLMCNFVYQRRPDETRKQFFAKTTHSSVLYPLISTLIDVFGEKLTIRVGNAPLKGAIWQRIDADVGLSSLARHFNDRSGRDLVEIHDLRMNVQERVNRLGWTKERRNDADSGDIVSFDLAGDSMLDEHERESANYRVHTYPTSRIEACHGPGKHVYLLNRKVLDADLVISVPKLKTHEKVGLTAAIKGCVGSVAHKDCLAHHRKGSASEGGDEYPGSSPVAKALSRYHEFAYDRPLSPSVQIFRVADRIAGKLHRSAGGFVAGAWRGNDTCWRMAVDLARLLAHGTADGRILPEYVRPHFALTDGVIAGEGQGPLKPDPVELGYLGWSQDIAAADYVNAVIAGMDPSSLPIVSRSFGLQSYPVTPLPEDSEVMAEDEGGAIELAESGPESRALRMPRGW